jgi:hypothetical protein
MKKITLVLLILTVVTFEYCTSSKKTQKAAPKTSYATNVQPVVATACSPCHVGAQARVKNLGSYEAVKTNIDEIIARIQKNPTDKGFMPFKHPKLPDSTIQVFVKWKNDGFQN